MDSSDLSRSPSRSLSRSSDDYYHANHDDYDDVSDESHSSSEEESVRTTSSSPSNASSSASHPECLPYRLPPREVLDLAKSLSNCCVVQPPPPSVGGATLRGNTNGSTRGRRCRSGSGSEGHPVPVAESATPASFSDWRRHFHRTFFDEDDDENDVRDEEPETILSFLVTDPETETTDRGGNVARVDVYCRTGRVCTCRVVPVLSGDAVATTTLGSSDAASSPTSNSRTLFSSLLATPRTANGAGDASEGAGDKTSMTNHLPRPPHRVRRILRRNCSLAALRRILERPPRLLDISPSLVADSVGSSRRSSVGSSTGSSLASTVSRALRRRRNERRGSPSPKTKTWHTDPYTPEQRRFLEIQKRNHERRMRREERWRVRIAKSILAGEEDEEGFLEGRRWDDSEEEEDGVSLCHQGSMSETTASASTASEGWKAPRDVGLRAVKVEVETTTSEEMGAWYEEQKSIRRRIELADTALAILMGEAEVLEKMMAAFHPEEEEREADQENVAKKKTRESDRWQSQRNGRQTRDGRDDDDSVSTLDDTHEPDEDDDEHDDASFYDESEAEEIAKLLQGCQIEYSFPFEHHPDLEDALLPRRHSISDDEDDTSHHASTDDSHTQTDESKPSFAAARSPHRRGRSLTSTRECTNQSRRVADSLPTYHPPPLPSVTAIPTDGEGCIVLRETGAFTVIGDLPRGLSEALFRRRGPLPSYIALGTKGRYYVRFEDGTSSFHGPASLDRLWNEPASSDTFRGTKAATRGKTNRRRRDHHPTPPKSHRPVPIASIAFGKKFTDYFLVRADGSWEANGDLPSGLEKLLDDRRHRGDLRWVALGPEGEWCVKARNGRVWWGGVSREIDEVLGDILIDGREELNFIDFGVEGSYFLIYR